MNLELTVSESISGVLDDFYSGAGASKAPSVAWGEAPNDFTVTGVLISVEKTEQTKPGTKPGDPDHILRYDNGDARTQLEFTLQTAWRNFEAISEDTVAKMKADGREDDGKRRVYIKGSPKQKTTTNGAFLEALKAAGVQHTEVALGATVSLKKIGKHANPYGGAKIPDFAARYERPTPESLAQLPKADVDPWAEPAAPSGGSFGGSAIPDEPPF